MKVRVVCNAFRANIAILSAMRLTPVFKANQLATVLSLFALLVLPYPPALKAQSNPGPGAPGSADTPSSQTFRMLSASSGTKGVEQNGRFIILDPRTTFHSSEDRKVIVEFEWEGPMGPHHFDGLWKDPSGKVVVSSNYDFTVQHSPFSGYFSMLLDETAPTGFWTIESHIDGQSSGSFTFEIASGVGTTPVKLARVPPAEAEVYRQAASAAVFVDKLDVSGKSFGHASGFFIEPGEVLTSFGSIDGASQLRVTLSSGKTLTTNQILAWNRSADWALLSMSGAEGAPLKEASGSMPAVGNRCFVLGISSAGGRILGGSDIVGEFGQDSMRRLNLSAPFDPASVGSPIMDEYGDVFGFLGGNIEPGVPLAPSSKVGLPPPAGSRAESPMAFAVPIALVKQPGAGGSPVTLDDLAKRGEFIPPLKDSAPVSYGTLALSIDKKNGGGWPVGSRDQFSPSDNQFVVFLNWDSKSKIKAMAVLKFYDVQNHPIAESPPAKVNIRSGNLQSTTWSIPLSSLRAGTYRAEVSLDGTPVWREFFRITP